MSISSNVAAGMLFDWRLKNPIQKLNRGLSKMKSFKTLTLLLVMLCMCAISVFAVDLGTTVSVQAKIDGDSISPDEVNRVDFTRGDIVDVEVRLNSSITLEDVEITAMVSGYEFGNIEPMSDTSGIFDMDPNVSYKKRLSVRIPSEVEEDNYKLRVLIADRYGKSAIYDYNLRLDSPRHGFQIEDVVFSPGTVVEAGRALLTTVRVENMGESEEESVKVTVAIPELGISASDFIDSIDYEDSETSEEMYMRIPSCAAPGDYNAVIEIRYNELRESTYKNTVVTVTKGESCPIANKGNEPQTVIAMGTTSQNLVPGQAGALYPLTITNNGAESEVYTVSVDGANDFATVQVNPVSTFILKEGESQAVFLYLTPVEGAAKGQRVFTATVKAGNEVIKQLPLTANVEAGSAAKTTAVKMDARNALEVGLIVLVVLLIILAVIVGVKKLKKDEEDSDSEDVEGKTYY